MLKEKMTKVKNFVVDHKKEIAIGVGVIVGGVVVYKIVKSLPKNDLITDVEWSGMTEGIEDLEIPKLDVGTIDELWKDQWGKSLILNDITVGDMGKIGEEFLKIDGVTKDTVVTATIGLLDELNNGVFLEN